MKRSVNVSRRGRFATAVCAVILASAADAADRQTPVSTGLRVEESAPPQGFSSWNELMAAQVPLNQAADELSALIESQRMSGFSGIILDVPGRKVTLYWKAGHKLPVEVSDLLGKLDTRPGVQTAVADAAYSNEELEAETQRLFQQASAQGLAPGMQILKVAPLPGWAGLRVKVSGSAEEASRLQLFRQSPVQLSFEQGKPAALLSRMDDWAPFYGGARIRMGTSPDANECSSGFAVGNIFGKALLTASHCPLSNGVPIYTGVGNHMGVSEGYYKRLDTVRINVMSAGSIYDGGVGTGEFLKGVVGYSQNYIGNWVCTSGSFSGARCNIMVTNLNIYWQDRTTYTYGPMVEAEEQSQQSAAGPGDSGGPVFSLATTEGDVIAKGTISGGDSYDNPATCTGDTSRTGCSYRIFYPDIKRLLDQHSMWIETE
jgi:hypothetical protein